MKKIKYIFMTLALATLLLPSGSFAASPIGTSLPQPTGATKLVTTADGLNSVSFQQTGTPVFASNAPETIWNGPRSADGKVMNQVNKTLYRDNMTGNFRFWSVHSNMTNSSVNFYMHVKNPSATSAVKLYIKRKGYAVSHAAAAAATATQQFMSQDGVNAGTLLATIPAGGTYVYQYASSVAHERTMDFVADFRAVSVATDGDAMVVISNIVTNNGTTNIENIAIQNVVETNHGYKNSNDDYRGVLQYSGRVVNLKINLTPSNYKKFIKIADGKPEAYLNEQEPLKTRWTVGGTPLTAPTVVAYNGKERGAYWLTDLTYNINITNSSGYSTVSTYYGAAPNLKPAGFINYKIGSLTQYKYESGQAIVINNNLNYTLKTVVQPSLTLPLGLYFVATN
ncbi:hypothetical protein I6N90_18045 [Paenibacillus sp. GSMTC-2017]|uniref:hypothetical protein n=1 Tax=Paenibacillus sp. GSMTC-2017 TaxID=2794350 RepID=UPI0018D7FE23|nr:hypothetical protein [Paenibacillus sp. GSMTC-2017]MBH5319702.1 hypothetical protein [Paenibacillus sp. GSMTC-2017]